MSQSTNTTWWDRWRLNISVVSLLTGGTALGAAIYWQRDREDRALATAQAYVREHISDRLQHYPTREQVILWRREDLRETNATIAEVLRELRELRR